MTWPPKWASNPAELDRFRRRLNLGSHSTPLRCKACGSQIATVSIMASKMILRKRTNTHIDVEVDDIVVLTDEDALVHLLPTSTARHCGHRFIVDDPALVESWRTLARRKVKIFLAPVSA